MIHVTTTSERSFRHVSILLVIGDEYDDPGRSREFHTAVHDTNHIGDDR
jgi:hypothetical protein